MEQKRNAIIIGVVVIIAFAALAFLYMKKAAINELGTPTWQETPVATDTPVAKRIVTAKHQFKNGTHIIAGEVEIPTPCHILTSSATASADKTKAFLELHTAQKAGETCAQVISSARFKVELVANKDAVWSATLNREEVILNLIEADPNEDLSKFELFIKG